MACNSNHIMLSFQMESLRAIAKKFNVDVEFDLSDCAGPIVNFIGGTNDEQLKLAQEIDRVFCNNGALCQEKPR